MLLFLTSMGARGHKQGTLPLNQTKPNQTKPNQIWNRTRSLPQESSGFPSGHLMPYRLVAGPLLRLSPAEGGGNASGPAAGSVPQGVPQEERRRFLVLYEIVAAEGSDRPPPPNRGGGYVWGIGFGWVGRIVH